MLLVGPQTDLLSLFPQVEGAEALDPRTFDGNNLIIIILLDTFFLRALA